MAAHVVIWAVSAHAVLMVLLTRLRLGGYQDAARRIDVGRAVVTTHTACGAGAAALWLAWLLDDAWFTTDGRRVVGVSAVALWWLVALAGLLILARWLPSHGTHAESAVADSWSRGPWLSVVAHVPVVLDVAVLTWALSTGTR